MFPDYLINLGGLKMDKKLRMLATMTVLESRVSNAAKIKMLKFIKEKATAPQLKSLLMDGRIYRLDEQAIEIVNDRFAVHPLNESGVFLQTIAHMTGVLVPWRKLAALFSDAHRQCGIRKISKDRDACLANARLQYAKKRIEIIKKAMSECNKMDNPSQCKAVMKAQLAKEEAKAKKQQEKLNKEISKGRAPSQEPAPIVATRD